MNDAPIPIILNQELIKDARNIVTETFQMNSKTLSDTAIITTTILIGMQLIDILEEWESKDFTLDEVASRLSKTSNQELARRKTNTTITNITGIPNSKAIEEIEEENSN